MRDASTIGLSSISLEFYTDGQSKEEKSILNYATSKCLKFDTLL
jgi:hypothetical protein